MNTKLSTSPPVTIASLLCTTLTLTAFQPAAHATTNTKFVSTGNLQTGRAYHTATLLDSGKVLILGGQDTNQVAVAASELFVRSTGMFTNSGAMITARYRHTATRLPGGKVLIVGGLDVNNNPIASAELYDPVAGQFNASHGSLANARYNHQAVLLPDGSGKVLIITGIGANGALASVEIYNSASDTFSVAAPLNTGRYFATSTPVTAHGALKVLVAGGFDSLGNVLTSAELYDPSTGAWTFTGGLAAGRYEAASAVLFSGSVLTTGGNDTNGIPLASCEIYNPDAGSFSAADSLTIARSAHTATSLATGKVLVAGGVGTGTPSYPQQAEVFKASGSKKIFAPGEFDVTGKMITGRFAHTATLMANGQVLFTGGIGTAGLALNSCEIFRSWAGEAGDDDNDTN
jgi:hypothetical protein